MNKKYRLEGPYCKGIEHDYKDLYRIISIKDFSDVKSGDIGGFVEGEHNLSHNGDCWIYDNAAVFGNAFVKEDAIVKGEAIVRDDAFVTGAAVVADYCVISDKAIVRDNALIQDNVVVEGEAVVKDESVVENCVKITNRAIVEGWSIVGRVDESIIIGGYSVIKCGEIDWQ